MFFTIYGAHFSMTSFIIEGACFLTATPWHPKDTAALHESGDSQDSQAGEVQHEKVQAKYGEDATRLRLLYYADDQDDS